MSDFYLYTEAQLSEQGEDLLKAVGENLLGRVACSNGNPVGIVHQIAAKASGYHAVVTRIDPSTPVYADLLSREPEGMIDTSLFSSVDYI